MFGFRTQYKKSEFGYIPRYYDENKEDLRKRVRAIKEAMGEGYGQKPKPGSDLKGAFSRERSRKMSEEQIRLRNSNIRLIAIMLLLLYLGWQLFTTDFFQDFLEKFQPGLHDR